MSWCNSDCSSCNDENMVMLAVRASLPEPELFVKPKDSSSSSSSECGCGSTCFTTAGFSVVKLTDEPCGESFLVIGSFTTVFEACSLFAFGALLLWTALSRFRLRSPCNCSIICSELVRAACASFLAWSSLVRTLLDKAFCSRQDVEQVDPDPSDAPSSQLVDSRCFDGKSFNRRLYLEPENKQRNNWQR